MLKITIVFNILSMVEFSVFRGFLFAFIIIYIPLTSKSITYIHEIGHCTHLAFVHIQIKAPFVKPDITLSKKRNYLQYSGLTSSPLYKYLSENKPNTYNKIRLNAISGTLFITIVYIMMYIFNTRVDFRATLITLCTLEILNFFSSSDFKYFLHPELFDYK